MNHRTHRILRTVGWLTYFVSMSGVMILGLILAPRRVEAMVCDNVNIAVKDSAKGSIISSNAIVRTLKKCDIDFVGHPLNTINLDSIEHLLGGKISGIKTIACYRTAEHNIRIVAKGRTPIFHAISLDQNWYMDDEGVLMTQSNLYAADVPIVTGKIDDMEFLQQEVSDFVKFIIKDKLWNAQIEQIHINNDKTIVLVPRVGDQIIYMGTLDDYRGKLTKLETLYKRGFNTLGWNIYSKIDLSYKGQVVCKKRKQ